MKKNDANWSVITEEDLFEDEYDDFDEEEDQSAILKGMNKRKTMAPVHVYRILVARTNPEHHMSQAEISRILESKYDIKVERKAVARAIHTLCDEGLGIKASKRDGVWYDSSAVWDEIEE